jgi:hypothetical protein
LQSGKQNKFSFQELGETQLRKYSGLAHPALGTSLFFELQEEEITYIGKS